SFRRRKRPAHADAFRPTEFYSLFGDQCVAHYSSPAHYFHGGQGVGGIFFFLSDGARRSIFRPEAAPRPVRPRSLTERKLLRASQNKLFGLAACDERGGNRSRRHCDLARHAAREFHAHSFSRGILLLQLAPDTWLARHRARHRRLDSALRSLSEKPRARIFRGQ